MNYANVSDVQARMSRTLDSAEERVCKTLLDDAGVMIDAVAPEAALSAKKLVSCRMVARALGDGAAEVSFPVGAQQGSMSALSYSQQWTLPNGGGAGELYLGKTEKQLLGAGNRIGAYSPVQELVVCHDPRNYDPTSRTRADRC